MSPNSQRYIRQGDAAASFTYPTSLGAEQIVQVDYVVNCGQPEETYMLVALLICYYIFFNALTFFIAVLNLS